MTRAEDAWSATDIVQHFQGLITSGRLGADERLPSVRQTAADLGVANGTVAKAYKQLEEDGLVLSRRGAGTRVAHGAARLPAAIVHEVRRLVDACDASGVAVDDVVSALLAESRSRQDE